MDWIAEVAKHHKRFIKNVHGLGVHSQAEDIVQEMYLRLHKYSSKEKCITDGKVNVHYIWRILYSLCNDYRRDSKRFQVVSLDDCSSFTTEYENPEREQAYERIIQKLFKEIDRLDNPKAKYKYNKELFMLYAGSDMSMRCVSSVTKISLTSIFNTLKQCKEHLSEELIEDIEDYNNEQYELIK